MRMSIVLAAVLVALALGLPAAGAPTGAVGQIAYGTVGSSGIDIHVVNADGTGDHVLWPRSRWPSWSPDGSRLVVDNGLNLAMVSSDGIETPISLSDADTEVPEFQASWSPDGS